MSLQAARVERGVLWVKQFSASGAFFFFVKTILLTTHRIVWGVRETVAGGVKQSQDPRSKIQSRRYADQSRRFRKCVSCFFFSRQRGGGGGGEHPLGTGVGDVNISPSSSGDGI